MTKTVSAELLTPEQLLEWASDENNPLYDYDRVPDDLIAGCIALAKELLASRHQEPVNEPAEWQVEAESALIERIGEICFKRHEAGFIFWPLMDVDRIKVELRQALRVASIPKVEPGERVKPLGWTDCATNRGPGFDIADRHRLGVSFAGTPLGTYVIASGPANRYEAWLRSGQVTGSYSTKDEAKAAAQADYEQRIRSALEPIAPVPVTITVELERLREFASSFHITVVDNFYKDVTLHLDSPHALSIRLRNDSSKSWLFADLETRRRAALGEE